MLRITILTENTVRRRGLLAEHGLSLWIADNDDRVLFDTGQSDVYLHNAKALGIDVADTHAIVLSHGHYDHGGGLASYPHEARWPRVFVHPDAFLPKSEQARQPNVEYRAIGFPWQKQELDGLDRHLVPNTSIIQVGDNLYACAAIPQTTTDEKPSANLMVRRDNQWLQDDLHDEQFLVSRREQGLVVMLGCSHPGVVNSLRYVQQLFPDIPIRMIIGGMHLERVSEDRLQQTIDFLGSLNADIIPLHCTGQQAIGHMKQALGERVLIRCTGDQLVLD